MFTEAGEWFIQGLEDGVTSEKVRVATIKGKYRSGQPAIGLLNDGGQTHKLAMESDSHLVCVQVAGSLPKTLASTPLPLKSVLEFLESCGKVQATFIGHTVEPKSDGTGYTVTANDVKTESSGQRMSIDNIAGLVDTKLLAEGPYATLVDTWQYQTNKNKFVPGYPTVWFKGLVNLTPKP